jgi:hypothetical protein
MRRDRILSGFRMSLFLETTTPVLTVVCAALLHKSMQKTISLLDMANAAD